MVRPWFRRCGQMGARSRPRQNGMGLPSTSRGGANNGATLNWPARARNASSSWLRRSGGDGGKRRTTSSAASRNSFPCARRGRCELLPVRGGSVGGGGSSAARCSAPWPRRCWAAAGVRRRSLPETSTCRSGGSLGIATLHEATLARLMRMTFSDAGTADAARKSARKNNETSQSLL